MKKIRKGVGCACLAALVMGLAGCGDKNPLDPGAPVSLTVWHYYNGSQQVAFDALVEEYYAKYRILDEGRDAGEFRRHVAVQAGIEIGFERFLKEKDYHAIVTHFGDLGSLKQLPGLAIQRLMEKGYGFGGEGETLILNANHPLVKYVNENQEGENVGMICEQLYDLAKIQHAPLSPEAMTKFIARSNEIMMVLAK